jgi:alkanesulfonate monooxygenase SsuD/methylene tetrahydromethanopterin reductase-like flavin-dependent oxidoreductase (luciferase family)
VAPKPAHGTIPVWIGGHTPRALRRVAELGDGWHAAFPSAAKMKAGLADLATACRQVGRDMGSLTISARLGLPARQDRDALVREIRELAALGVSHVILESRVRDLDDMTAIYETFARETRPLI